MTPSQDCIDFIKSREGLKLNAYQDSAGIWTIGYGTIHYEDSAPVKKGDVIDEARAEALLTTDVAPRAAKVNAMVADTALNQNQFDALVSFAYNVGTGALQTSTLLKRVKANPADATIRDAFMMWDRAHVNGQSVVIQGLANRRTAEADLYFS